MKNSIVLLTNSPPGENGVGQNYVRDVFSVAPFDRIHCCAALRQKNDWTPKDAPIDQSLVLEQRYESAFRPRIAKGLIAQTALQLKSIPFARQQAKSVAEFCGSVQSQDVLVVLESPQMMLMGEFLCNNSDLRLHTLVWDHPEHVISSFGHVGHSRHRLLKAFYNCIDHSQSIMTVADSLRDLLKKRNDKAKCTAIRSPVQRLPVEQEPNPAEQFVVGLAGSVTAPDELNNLQSALDMCNWVAGGKKVVLRLFGFRYVLSAKAPRNVEYRGFLSTTADVIKALSLCDACFLPQPFAAEKRYVAEYSFPTKFTTYLASGRPVLIHAPAYGSIPKFVGSQCRALKDVVITDDDSSKAVESIAALASNEDFRCRARLQSIELCRKEFSKEACRSRLTEHFS